MKPNSKSIFKITKSSRREYELPEPNDANCISSSDQAGISNQKLCVDESQLGSYTVFEYTRPDGGVSHLNFTVQWYNPSNGTWNNKSEGNPSGAYLFKPKIGD